ncbi:protein SMAX1-LIKE 8-like isoform X1 [Camellia sinensis]|uniref:protein SMAX1-LIKE 8-like isoform X1 n=1 Tax=Camellia sinensis TaxID=4442 RepID=UPI001036D889|nr:protein SMAX1-LIKE 8-like isoform X1 [Camellia sinensis]
MPTPVSAARQCLTPEAAHALDEAVSVARRRAHAQTTSLHAVSALLSLPSSALRESCGRARNSAYSARIQFKALELCLGVSLDRLPSSPPQRAAEEPPVSNSLMAAIKRSQANQRRQPESFHLYQQQQIQQQTTSSSSSVSMVKVELQNLILSILDDPVVSRVFGEAGFRSCDIKLAILRPVHQLLRYSRFRAPPMFLCNLTADKDLNRRGFSFPFLGFPGISNGSDDNSKRIGDVLVKNKGRNPLLIGVSATDSLRSFCELVERRKGGCVLPVEIYGLSVIRIENDVSKLVNENCNQDLVKLKFGEVGELVEHCIGPGVVISYGDLKVLIGDDDSVVSVAASCVVRELTRLLDVHGGKVWLIGAAGTYETYLKFLNRFPSVEKDWDLQLLPITSLRPNMAESYPRSSLMESFVPFGGFFSTSADLKSPLGGSYQCLSRCHLCNEKCEQEVSAVAKGGFTASVAEQNQSSLPSWLQMTELSTNRGLDFEVQAKDDGLTLSAKVKGLQRKWDNICQRLHHSEQLTKTNTYQVGSQVSSVVGYRVGGDKKENADNQSSNETNASSNASGCRKVTSCTSMDIQQQICRSQLSIPLPGVSKDMDSNFLSKPREKTSESEDLELVGLGSPLSLSNSSVGDAHTSPHSATSVTTDLGLGTYSASTIREPKKPTNQTTDLDLATVSTFNHPAQSSSGSCLVFDRQFDQRDFKMLYRALSERISWQEEAVSAISQAIARCRTRNEKRFGATVRGDIWFTFLGPDSFSKRRIASSLVEILYGNRGNFISVDLSSQELNGYDVKFRGKTVVDYVVGELSKKPLSVVFLENIDKADVITQNSLSQARRTGRFLDSYRREVVIHNTVFVTTSRFTKGDKFLSSAEETGNYSEESILRAKGWAIQMVINYALGNGVINNNTRKFISSPVILNKRKSIGTSEIIEESETSEMAKRAHKASNMHLDLNLPAEEIEIHNTECGSENFKVWLEDFVELVDETVVFKPFDFDKLAEKISKEISECFHKIVGSDCSLEIDSKVMEQILAASCLSENNKVNDWIEQVLGSGFIEAQKRYNLTTPCAVKLVTCEGLFSKEQAPGIPLPARIVVN